MMRSLVISALCCVFASPVPVPAADRQTVLVVVGAPGEDEYGEVFEESAKAWLETARRGGAEAIRIEDRDVLEQAVAKRVAAATDDDLAIDEAMWIVFIGHGTFDRKVARFNLKGRDISAAELAHWLEGYDHSLAIINCASASGPFINRLSGPRRTIVTATRSGFEYNYARFGMYMAKAIGETSNDLDKDEQISLLEAFLAAATRTREFYEQEARLATEHALIDDNGDARGTPAEWFRGVRAIRKAKDGAVPDGLRARQLVLVRSKADESLPAERRARRDELELELERLRQEEPAGDGERSAAYWERLEKIALELARIYER